MTVVVEVWSWPLRGGDPGVLSPDEAARAARFAHPRDRDRYVAGRSRLRTILAGILGGAPGDLAFAYGPWGRPAVEGLSFNLAHTGDLALLAVSRDATVGVDVEAVAPIGSEVARAHLAPGEARALEALPEPERTRAFYRCWTRKEAYLKGRGTGLATDLASFEVSLGPDEPPRLLRCDGGEADRWALRDLDAGSGLAAALAVRAEGRRVSVLWRSRA